MTDDHPAVTEGQAAEPATEPKPDEVTVESLIKRAGGATKLAEASNGSFNIWASYKWKTAGIPLKHWPLIMERTGCTTDDIFNANKKATEDAANADAQAEAGTPPQAG